MFDILGSAAYSSLGTTIAFTCIGGIGAVTLPIFAIGGIMGGLFATARILK